MAGMRYDLIQESFSSPLAWRSLSRAAFSFCKLLLALLGFFWDQSTSAGHVTCCRQQGDIWMCPSFFSNPFPVALTVHPIFLTASELNIFAWKWLLHTQICFLHDRGRLGELNQWSWACFPLAVNHNPFYTVQWPCLASFLCNSSCPLLPPWMLYQPQHTLTMLTDHWKPKQTVSSGSPHPQACWGLWGCQAGFRHAISLKRLGSLLSPVLLAHVSTNLLFLLIIDSSKVKANYLLGVGRADCTGPVAEIPLVSWGNWTWGWQNTVFHHLWIFFAGLLV